MRATCNDRKKRERRLDADRWCRRLRKIKKLGEEGSESVGDSIEDDDLESGTSSDLESDSKRINQGGAEMPVSILLETNAPPTRSLAVPHRHASRRRLCRQDWRDRRNPRGRRPALRLRDQGHLPDRRPDPTRRRPGDERGRRQEPPGGAEDRGAITGNATSLDGDDDEGFEGG